MRPLVLELRSFGAFRQPTQVSFEDTDFFALVGPTGAGKSTVVDAICFALYGTVPRYDDERLVGEAMSVGANETAVRLTFEVGGRRYVAARVVRRDPKGKVTTKEARLEDDAGQVLAGRASEMAAAVEAVLGLPFQHFTRCVVLPQGAFARFLHDTPKDRQSLLVGLLDLGVYERMAKDANARGAAAKDAAQLAQQQAAAMADATPDALQLAEARAVAIATLVAHIDEQLPALRSLHVTWQDAAAAAAHARQLVAALQIIAVPAPVRELGAAVSEAAERVAAAEQSLAQARAGLAQQRAQRAALPELAPLQVALSAHERAGRAREEQQAAASEVRMGADALAALAASFDEAQTTVRTAVEHFEHVRDRNAAVTLAQRLVAGQPCPVCQQVVREVPGGDAPDDLVAARKAVERAESSLEAVTRARDKAARAVAAAEATDAAARRAVAELAAAVAAHPDAEALALLVKEVRGAEAAVADATDAEVASARALEGARSTLTAAQAASADVRGAYAAQRDAVVELGPPPPGPDPVSSWQELEAWAEHVRPKQVKAAERADRDAARAGQAHRQQAAALMAAADAAGVAAPDVDALPVVVARAHEQAGHAVERLRTRLTEREQLEQRAAEHTAAAQVALQLGRLLGSSQFVRWLVTEALQRLADGGSETLQRLSAGAYSLELDERAESFVVVDHLNGDERRGVRTLSGGETFQASLALALALSEHLAGLASGGVAKLDAIFLDEGFGTLDPESLDTVASTIEALATGGRMVGVVTHVRELAARVPVRYEVRKGALGATVTRVVA